LYVHNLILILKSLKKELSLVKKNFIYIVMNTRNQILIDERENEIWEKAKDLASEPELLIHYLHTILLARRLGRNE